MRWMPRDKPAGKPWNPWWTFFAFVPHQCESCGTKFWWEFGRKRICTTSIAPFPIHTDIRCLSCPPTDPDKHGFPPSLSSIASIISERNEKELQQ